MTPTLRLWPLCLLALALLAPEVGLAKKRRRRIDLKDGVLKLSCAKGIACRYVVVEENRQIKVFDWKKNMQSSGRFDCGEGRRVPYGARGKHFKSFGTRHVRRIEFSGGQLADEFDASEVRSVRVVANGKDGPDTLIGGAQPDDLRGGKGGDTIVGAGGNDRIQGNSGPDILCGGRGVDRIDGGDGGDRIYGGDGDDDLTGGSGDDHVFGAEGNDRINGQAGRDFLNGDDGDDRVVGGDGDDVLNGGWGDDRLEGGKGKDQLWGGRGGNDTCHASRKKKRDRCNDCETVKGKCKAQK